MHMFQLYIPHTPLPPPFRGAALPPAHRLADVARDAVQWPAFVWAPEPATDDSGSVAGAVARTGSVRIDPTKMESVLWSVCRTGYWWTEANALRFRCTDIRVTESRRNPPHYGEPRGKDRRP